METTDSQFTEYLIILLSFAFGGAGYLIVNFWMAPLLKFLEIKHEVTSDLVFYANAINADDLNDRMKELQVERQERNRRHASELRASYFRLPFWYKKVLKFKNENPIEVSKCLIGLSNTKDFDIASRKTEDIKSYLNIKDELK